MHKIVHLDLKGAPLKITYLENVFSIIKTWGATGVLLEWEDTFPYSSELMVIGSQKNAGGDGMYSLDEVKDILTCAKEFGLEAIQLVQTIGHMEFVLKHAAFKGLREVPIFPAVLCPSIPESQKLVRSMLEQIMDVQPDATYLHIGADEVWHTAVCMLCQKRAASSEHKAASLYLDHIRDLALFIKQKMPNVTILMWDDMLRSTRVETLKAYELGNLVEPVLWHYNAMECFNINTCLWVAYKKLFPKIWAGSAYKGANGSCQILSPVSRYASNNEAWLMEFKKHGTNIYFAGTILTGWSRYDHYATLCELLPVSLPSLASCLRILNNGAGVPFDMLVSDVLPSDQWPGEEFARCIHSFVVLRDKCNAFIHGDLIATWLNPWQIAMSYTNPVQIQSIAFTATRLLTDMILLQSKLLVHFHEITGKRTVEEWTRTFITPICQKLDEIRQTAELRTSLNASVKPISK